MSCTTEPYAIGANVVCRGECRNTAGNLFDPGAIFFVYRDPSGNETEWEYGTDVQLGREDVGKYYAGVPVNEAGTWHYRFYSTGSGQAADEGSFEVAESNFS